jgi:hypothetical protein
MTDYSNLPPIPEGMGFEYQSYTPKELMDIMECSKSGLYKYLSVVRPYFGPVIRRIYNPEQSLILLMLFPPKRKGAFLMSWLARNGWFDYIEEKYGITELLKKYRKTKGEYYDDTPVQMTLEQKEKLDRLDELREKRKRESQPPSIHSRLFD